MKNKLKAFKQTHGAIIAEEPTVLDNMNKQLSHRISLAAQYEDKLSKMELEDLQNLASEMGLVPLDNRDVLIKSIKKEFKKK